MRHRKFLCILLLLSVLPVSTRAAGPSVALIFDSGPNGKYTRQLLEGLYDRGIRGTFLLQGRQMEDHPDILEEICRENHEVVFRGSSGNSLARMSRRAIAEELIHCQSLLTNGNSPRFFCPNGGISDGVRQVAQVRNLALLGWSAEPAHWPPGTFAPDVLRDGDILLLSDRTAGGVESALSLADQLLESGYKLLTVSQLAKELDIPIRPGRLYTRFSPD